MEERKTKENLPYWAKRDFFIKEKQKEIKNLLEIRKGHWTVYENILYPNVDIREISEWKNNKLLISADILSRNEQWKYIEINWERFYELNKGWKRKEGNYYYIDQSKDVTWVFHIWKIIGFEKGYNKEYAIRNGQAMRKDWSIHTGNSVIDVE